MNIINKIITLLIQLMIQQASSYLFYSIYFYGLDCKLFEISDFYDNLLLQANLTAESKTSVKPSYVKAEHSK